MIPWLITIYVLFNFSTRLKDSPIFTITIHSMYYFFRQVEELKEMLNASNPNDPIVSSISVVEFGIEYEQMYIDWCERCISRL